MEEAKAFAKKMERKKQNDAESRLEDRTKENGNKETTPGTRFLEGHKQGKNLVKLQEQKDRKNFAEKKNELMSEKSREELIIFRPSNDKMELTDGIFENQKENRYMKETTIEENTTVKNQESGRKSLENLQRKKQNDAESQLEDRAKENGETTPCTKFLKGRKKEKNLVKLQEQRERTNFAEKKNELMSEKSREELMIFRPSNDKMELTDDIFENQKENTYMKETIVEENRTVQNQENRQKSLENQEKIRKYPEVKKKHVAFAKKMTSEQLSVTNEQVVTKRSLETKIFKKGKKKENSTKLQKQRVRTNLLRKKKKVKSIENQDEFILEPLQDRTESSKVSYEDHKDHTNMSEREKLNGSKNNETETMMKRKRKCIANKSEIVIKYPQELREEDKGDTAKNLQECFHTLNIWDGQDAETTFNREENLNISLKITECTQIENKKSNVANQGQWDELITSELQEENMETSVL